MATTGTRTPSLSHVYPIGSALDERGHLTIGGCDVQELAATHGTPAYLVAEDDLRARAREFRDAFAALHAVAPGSKLVVTPGGHHRSVQHDPELQAYAARFLVRSLT